MKRLSLLVVYLSLLAIGSSWAEEKVVDAKDEPHHRPKFVNEVVRVVDVELMSAAAVIVGAVIEPGLRAHCRVAGIRGGLLTIHADQPALLFPLKQRFGAAIERRLAQSRKTAGVRRVAFQWGTEGMPLM